MVASGINNNLLFCGQRTLILGHISIRLVPFQIKTEGESIDPVLVMTGQTMENPL